MVTTTTCLPGSTGMLEKCSVWEGSRVKPYFLKGAASGADAGCVWGQASQWQCKQRHARMRGTASWKARGSRTWEASCRSVKLWFVVLFTPRTCTTESAVSLCCLCVC